MFQINSTSFAGLVFMWDVYIIESGYLCFIIRLQNRY